MTTRPRARRLASALLLCAVAPTALGGEPASAPATGAGAGAPSAAPSRRPPPAVVVVPLGFGVLLPLTVPTAPPRVRAAGGPSGSQGAPPSVEGRPARAGTAP